MSAFDAIGLLKIFYCGPLEKWGNEGEGLTLTNNKLDGQFGTGEEGLENVPSDDFRGKFEQRDATAQPGACQQ
jgi:hypothetical protein